jgi:hypothetical protein
MRAKAAIVVVVIGLVAAACRSEPKASVAGKNIDASETSTSSAPTTTTATTTTATTFSQPPATAPTGPSCGGPADAPGLVTGAQPGIVPNAVCMDLQLAQDKAQAAGFYSLGSEDATGRARNQVLDRDWVVIGQTPSAGTTASASTGLVFRVLRYGDPGAPPMPNRSLPGRVPKLACFDLQEAQDTLQSVGFGVIASEDATGQGRSQIVDRNWTVTGQSPASGSTVSKATQVILKAVKDGELSSCA